MGNRIVFWGPLVGICACAALWAADDEGTATGRDAARGPLAQGFADRPRAEDYLARIAPWTALRVEPVPLDTGFPLRGPLRVGADGTEAGEGAGLGNAPGDTARPLSRADRLRLSPAEALEVRVNSGLEPPRMGRDALVASSFAPTAMATANFAELPGGIVFGLRAKLPEDLDPVSVELDDAGQLWLVDQNQQRHCVGSAPLGDMLATLEQARSTRGSDALVSITRSGRAQLSAPFARVDAGAELARADLAPFAHLGDVAANKSVILDSAARLVRRADGTLEPLVDLELRLYRSSDSDGLFAETLASAARRQPARAQLVRTLIFEADAERSTLEFAEQSPNWWSLPPLSARAGLERDLAPASRLGAWTALWRTLDERETKGLTQVAEALQQRVAAQTQRGIQPAPPLR